jgi:hypothetical protein
MIARMNAELDCSNEAKRLPGAYVPHANGSRPFVGSRRKQIARTLICCAMTRTLMGNRAVHLARTMGT